MLNRLRRPRRDGSQDDADSPWLIVGLGNPGKRYERTRHNAGFMVIGRLADRLPGGTRRSRFQAEILETHDGDRKLILAMPTTFMNESGIAVSQIARWHKVPRDRLLLIYDELDLPFGTIRVRANGSAGGHNGVSSVIKHLNTQEFARLRLGINRPQTGQTVPYVLSQFTSAEQKELPAILDRAADAALLWLREGVTVAMNEHNRRSDADEPKARVEKPETAESAANRDLSGNA